MNNSFVHSFLRGPRQNAWIHHFPVEVYARKGLHAIDGEPVWCLDIANINVHEGYLGQGHFTRFLELCEQAIEEVDVVYIPCIVGDQPRIVGIYVENVMLDRFAGYLIRRGFEGVSVHGGIIYDGRAPSYFLPRRLSFGSLVKAKSHG